MPFEEPNPSYDIIARAIAGAAERADTRAESLTVEQRLTVIEEQIARLEPLLEDREQATKLATVLNEYVGDLRDEQSFMNKARWGVGGLALLLIVSLMALLGIAVFNDDSPLLRAPAYPAAIFVVGCISGAVLLLTGLMKSVFRTASERHSEGFLPPQLDAAMKLVDRLKGGS